jgi:hypothetical protein
LFGNAKGRTSFKLKEVHRLYKLSQWDDEEDDEEVI